MTQNNLFQTRQVNTQAVAVSGSFMASVFSWMALAMALTAFTAYYFASSAQLMGYLVSATGGLSALGWIVTLSPIGFVLLMSFGYQRLSFQALTILFAVYAMLMGVSLSFVLLIYTAASIFKTFAVTAGMFSVMAFLGYTTKTDLTRFGSILMMALFGLIIAGLVNMFMKSPAIDYIISIIGVLVFTGLTAYDVQALKRIGAGVEFGTESTRKLIILGALRLYLDFINLFLFLLRFMGSNKE